MNRTREGIVGKNIFIIGLSYLFISICQNLWRTTFQNFAIEAIEISPIQIGIAYSIVSIPGFFSAILGFIGVKVRILKLLLISFYLTGVGLIGTGLAPFFYSTFKSINLPQLNVSGLQPYVHTVNINFLLLSIFLLLLHSGFATYFPTINTVFLLTVTPKKALPSLSALKSLGPISGTIGTAFVIFSITDVTDLLFLTVFGVISFVIGYLCFKLLPHANYHRKQQVLRLKRKLLPYYLLNFLNGCRSAIFKAFVIYYLISEFGFQLKSTAGIILIGNLFTFFGYQFIRKLVQRYDPANLLAFLYLVMAINFFGFFLVKDAKVLTCIYLVDSFVFCTSAITDGYLRLLSRGNELLSDLSVGVSLFYLGGIIMSTVGGMLFDRNDLQVFLLGSVFSLVAIVVTRGIAGLAVDELKKN